MNQYQKQKDDVSTLICSQTTVHGRVSGADEAEVMGTLHGSLKANSRVRIHGCGRVMGDVEAPVVIVQGQVWGEVKADKVIEMGLGARIFGRVSAPEVVMASRDQVCGEWVGRLRLQGLPEKYFLPRRARGVMTHVRALQGGDGK